MERHHSVSSSVSTFNLSMEDDSHPCSTHVTDLQPNIWPARVMAAGDRKPGDGSLVPNAEHISPISSSCHSTPGQKCEGGREP